MDVSSSRAGASGESKGKGHDNEANTSPPSSFLKKPGVKKHVAVDWGVQNDINKKMKSKHGVGKANKRAGIRPQEQKTLRRGRRTSAKKSVSLGERMEGGMSGRNRTFGGG